MPSHLFYMSQVPEPNSLFTSAVLNVHYTACYLRIPPVSWWQNSSLSFFDTLLLQESFLTTKQSQAANLWLHFFPQIAIPYLGLSCCSPLGLQRLWILWTSFTYLILEQVISKNFVLGKYILPAFLLPSLLKYWFQVLFLRLPSNYSQV